jgi:hypothetical protein
MQPNRGRTIAHRQQELKPRNWAPEVTGFFTFVQLVDFGLNRWFPCVELTQDTMVSTVSTHRRGGVLTSIIVVLATTWPSSSPTHALPATRLRLKSIPKFGVADAEK